MRHSARSLPAANIRFEILGSPCTMRSPLTGSAGSEAASASTRSASGRIVAMSRCAACSTSASRRPFKCRGVSCTPSRAFWNVYSRSPTARWNSASARPASRACAGDSSASRHTPSMRVSTRHTAPSCSSHSVPARLGTSRGVKTPLRARCSVTAAMSKFTAGGKIGFTRWSTSSAPRVERAYHVGLIRPEIAGSRGPAARSNASSTAAGGVGFRTAAIVPLS